MTTELTLPFFVYGTLRPDMGNQRVWVGRAWAEYDGEAHALGFRLVGAGRAFPYAIRTDNPTDVTYGAIIRTVPGHYHATLEAMDHLEGYPTHYDREPINVNTPHGVVRAWVYTPPTDPFTQHRLGTETEVPGGDWRRYRMARAGVR
jgi:gamma-glutamylcyclotransferase (GGCT)/AIG2-like uncharacterized protein YtfP